MSLENTIQEEFRMFNESESIVEALLNKETAYDQEPRAILGARIHEMEPAIPQEYYLMAPLESAIPAAKLYSKKKKKAFLEGTINRNFKSALNEIPEDKLFPILYSTLPKEDTDLAKKHKKFMKMSAAANPENPDLNVYLGEIKDKEIRSLIALDANANPQRVLNAFQSYVATLRMEFELGFANTNGEVNPHKVRSYVANNVDLASSKEKERAYLVTGRMLASESERSEMRRAA